MSRIVQRVSHDIFTILTAFILTACGGGGGDGESTVPTNNAPIAMAGNAQNVTTGSLVNLDGSASLDLDGNDVSYTWSLVTVPVGSNASLTSLNMSTTDLTVDLEGTYIVSLTVSDGIVDSASSAVTITATTMPSVFASSGITSAQLGVPVRITGAAVTYRKQGLAGEPAGFFIQAEQNGPAIFVRDSNTTLFTVGDIISFNADNFDLVSGRRDIILPISQSSLSASGYDTSALIQDVSNATDLVSSLADYSSELVTADFTITSDFIDVGDGYVGARIETTAVRAEPNLQLRISSVLNNSLRMQRNCTLSISALPVWRNDLTGVFTIENMDEALNLVCPNPRIVSAIATSATQVTVRFDRDIDPVSIIDVGTQFTFDNGLNAIAVIVVNNEVRITTDVQIVATVYTLTVSDTVQDNAGNGVDITANTQSFLGYTVSNTGLGLVISEIDYDTVAFDTLEFIEIYNPTSSSISLSGVRLVLVGGSILGGGLNESREVDYSTIDLSSALILAPDTYLVVGNRKVSGVDIVIPDNLIQNGSPDGLRLETPATRIDSLVYEDLSGLMKITVEGNPALVVDDNITPNLSLCRIPAGNDTDNNSIDFFSCVSSPGRANGLR